MMKKTTFRVSALALALLLICVSSFAAFAEITKEYALTDDAQVFNETQTADLSAKLKDAGVKTGWQFIVHTSNDGIVSDDDLESHYNKYYDSQGFQYDAIMLVIDRKSGKRDILTYGEVRDYFKDSSRYDAIKSAMRPYLDSDDMYGATLQFISKAADAHAQGKINPLLLSLKKRGWLYGILAVAAGLIFFFVNKSRYKNMGKAGTYDLAANSGVNLQDMEDTFVTQHTTVRTIQRDNNDNSSGSHSGGGNSSGGF